MYHASLCRYYRHALQLSHLVITGRFLVGLRANFEVCHPRCVVYNNVLTCKTLYLVNTTVFIYLCVIQHYMFRPSIWPSSGVSVD